MKILNNYIISTHDWQNFVRFREPGDAGTRRYTQHKRHIISTPSSNRFYVKTSALNDKKLKNK